MILKLSPVPNQIMKPTAWSNGLLPKLQNMSSRLLQLSLRKIISQDVTLWCWLITERGASGSGNQGQGKDPGDDEKDEEDEEALKDEGPVQYELNIISRQSVEWKNHKKPNKDRKLKYGDRINYGSKIIIREKTYTHDFSK